MSHLIQGDAGKGSRDRAEGPVQALCRPHPCGLHVHGPCVGGPAGSALLTDTPAPGQGAVIRGNQPHAKYGTKFPPRHNPVIQTPEREKVVFEMTVLPTHARQRASILPGSHRKVTSHIQPAFLAASVTRQRRDPSPVVSEQITLNTRGGQTCANVPAVPACRHCPSPARRNSHASPQKLPEASCEPSLAPRRRREAAPGFSGLLCLNTSLFLTRDRCPRPARGRTLPFALLT